jgi:hypothetical protein
MLFMDIKYAHRFDSPGCLELGNRTIAIEKMAFTMDGDCEQSNQPMHMHLELALYAEIDPDMSFYSDSSGGRLTVNLKKKDRAAWPLPISGLIKPTNMLIWWEMKEKYSAEMAPFEESTKTSS